MIDILNETNGLPGGEFRNSGNIFSRKERQFMETFMKVLIATLLIIWGTGCADEDHNGDGGHMHGSYGEIHRGSPDMVDMHGMKDQMHDLQLRTGQMVEDWQRRLEDKTGREMPHGHSMMNMSRHMNGMAEYMYGMIDEMDSLSNSKDLMEDDSFRDHFRQMKRHMNQMTVEYEKMLERMREISSGGE
jgi:hypothetical protein